MARKKNADTKKAKQLADQGVALADCAAKALVAAEQLRIKTKAVEQLPLDEGERAAVAELPTLAPKVKKKLLKKDVSLTVAETVSVALAVADSILDAEPKQRVSLLQAAKKLMDWLQANIVMSGPPTKLKKPKAADTVYQFTITLLGVKPPIWRRIQVPDCTLDKLHEHIQTAMGWTNSHLHQFDIKGERYGDPELLGDGFEGFECVDSTKTMLSDILPKSGKRFSFKYEYDFGDGWEHEVVFEGRPATDPKAKYPVCLDGARACPPEDCGGVWGYADLLEAISNKKHKEHKRILEWVGGWFDAEEFDPVTATKAMKKGLPDWRRMR